MVQGWPHLKAAATASLNEWSGGMIEPRSHYDLCRLCVSATSRTYHLGWKVSLYLATIGLESVELLLLTSEVA